MEESPTPDTTAANNRIREKVARYHMAYEQETQDRIESHAHLSPMQRRTHYWEQTHASTPEINSQPPVLITYTQRKERTPIDPRPTIQQQNTFFTYSHFLFAACSEQLASGFCYIAKKIWKRNS